MTWSAAEKNACMVGRRDRLNGGSLQLINAGSQVLVAFQLGTPSGQVVDDVLTFAGFPRVAAAALSATVEQPVAEGRLVNALGALVRSDLTVGLPGSNADIELTQLTWGAGQEVEIQAAPTLKHAP